MEDITGKPFMSPLYLKALDELNKHEAMRSVMTAEISEVSIKTNCLTCHSLMEGTWIGEPPYTIVCFVCKQSYTIDIQENSDDPQPQ